MGSKAIRDAVAALVDALSEQGVSEDRVETLIEEYDITDKVRDIELDVGDAVESYLNDHLDVSDACGEWLADNPPDFDVEACKEVVGEVLNLSSNDEVLTARVEGMVAHALTQSDVLTVVQDMVRQEVTRQLAGTAPPAPAPAPDAPKPVTLDDVKLAIDDAIRTRMRGAADLLVRWLAG